MVGRAGKDGIVSNIKAFGLEQSLGEWAKHNCCHVSLGELKRRLDVGAESAEKLLTDPYETGPRKSRYRGVTWHVSRKAWMAQIRSGSKVVFLGYYDYDKDAARAYNAAAKELGKRVNEI